MKKLLILLMCTQLACVSAFAQSVFPDSLFKAGISCYNIGRYKEALNHFSACYDYCQSNGQQNMRMGQYSRSWIAHCLVQSGDKEIGLLLDSDAFYQPVDPYQTEACDSVLVECDRLMDNDRAKEALPLLLSCLSFANQKFGGNHIYYGAIVEKMANCFATVKDYENAIISQKEYLRVLSEAFPVDMDRSLLWQVARYYKGLVSLGLYYSSFGEHYQALECFQAVNDNTSVGNIEYLIGGEYYSIGKSLEGAEARSYLQASLSYLEPLTRTKIVNLLLTEVAVSISDSYRQEAASYSESGDVDSAISLLTEAEQFEMEYLDGSYQQFKTLNLLTQYASDKGDYEMAVNKGWKIAHLIENVSGEDKSTLMAYYKQLLSMCVKGHYFEDANHIVEEMREQDVEMDILEKMDFLGNLVTLWSYFMQNKRFGEALQIAGDIKKTEDSEAMIHEDMPIAALALFACYIQLEEYDAAAPYVKEVEESTKLSIANYNMLAAYYMKREGDYPKTAFFLKKSLDETVRVYGHNSITTALCLSNNAAIYDKLGDHEQALSCIEEALDIYHGLNEEDKETLSSLTLNYAAILSNAGRYDDAIRQADAAIVMIDETNDRSGHMREGLSILASAYLYKKEYQKALLNMDMIIQLMEAREETDMLEYSRELNKKAVILCEMADYDNAITFSRKALALQESTNGEGRHLQADIYRNLAIIYSRIGDVSQMVQYAQLASDAFARIVQRSFSELTAVEQSILWDEYRKWFEHDVFALSQGKNRDGMYPIGYNSVLLSKGLLLHSSISFSTLIQESGDEEAISMFDGLKRIRRQIDEVQSRVGADKKAVLDSLEHVAQEKERTLLSRSQVFGDFTQNLLIDWRQVQSRLKKGEAAVEFVSFPVGEDSLQYTAYVVRPGMAAPAMIPLFEEAQLRAVSSDDYYTTGFVSELVWKPLEDQLDGVKTVYFAPSGQLYNIAIESVPDWQSSGTLVSDHRHYYRLSSTRELVLHTERNGWKDAVVFGGLEYNMGKEDLVAESRKHRGLDISSSTPYIVSDTSTIRSGASKLPGTLTEAQSVRETLEKASIPTRIFTDTLGTEGAFKDLSGEKTSLILLATHGFYWQESDVAMIRNKPSFLAFEDMDSQRYVEDKSLSRSGLLFAGANYTLIGKKLPEGVEDGILTARELSTMDLRGLDLVALSACQTGLGEITGEGVFGLQRGFKKAGANAILMSLWKVDDNATRLLMTRFMDNIVSGQSKHVALLEAQKYVREYETDCPESAEDPYFKLAQDRQETPVSGERCHPYASPYYWAAFILLDGLE